MSKFVVYCVSSLAIVVTCAYCFGSWMNSALEAAARSGSNLPNVSTNFR